MIVDQKEKAIFIGGIWKEAESGSIRSVINPATLEKLAEVS